MNVAKLADRVIEVLDGKILENSEDSLLDNKISV
jgi:putative ABC transport system ATP-binding protein